jgi:hypothetical protein
MPRRYSAPAVLGLLALGTAGPASGQRSYAVIPFVGYRVGGGFTDSQQFQWDIKDNLSYGGMLEFGLAPNAGVDLLYSHQASEVKTPAVYAQLASSYDLKVDNWLFGAYRGLNNNRGGSPSTMDAIGEGYLGLTHFASSAGTTASADRFSAGLGLGLRAQSPTGRIGLRLDARGLWTFSSGDGGWFCSLPGACVVTYTGTTMFQADFTAGVVITLGRSQAR